MSSYNTTSKRPYQKFSYLPLTRPNQSFSEQLKALRFFLFNNENRSYLLRDIEAYATDASVSTSKRRETKNILTAYKTANTAIFLLSLATFVFHYRKGTYHLNSYFLDLYIFTRTMLLAAAGYSVNLFALQRRTSANLFDYYTKKEASWKQSKDYLQMMRNENSKI